MIQWFPGHMQKTLKELEKQVKIVDVVLYILDSRAPFSCSNPSFEKIIQNKPILYIFNKYDLADEAKTKQWVTYFTRSNSMVLKTNATNGATKSLVQNALYKLAETKLEKYKQKGVQPVIRAMVIGVPNSGKSTLINTLVGAGKTKTGNIAGVTRTTQWVKVSEHIEVLDTPGTLWPSFENQQVAQNLAYIGSIKDNVVDVQELGYALFCKLCEMYPAYMQQRYNINLQQERIEAYEAVCVMRGCLRKGKEYDYERCGQMILDDFRKTRIGKITLESVEEVYEAK